MQALGTPPPKRPPVPRGAKILAITGAVLLVIAFVGAHAGLDAIHTRVRIIRNTGPDLRNSVLGTVKVPGTGTVELEPGDYDVFAISTFGSGFRRKTPTSTTTTTHAGSPSTTTAPPNTDPTTPTTTSPARRSPVGLDKPSVTLTDPDGNRLYPREPGIGAVFAGPSGEMYAVATFTVIVPGTYRLSARGGNAHLVGIAPTVGNSNTNKLIVSGLFTGLAFLAGGVGFLLGLIGVIWMLVGGKPKPAPLWPSPSGPAGWAGPAGWTPPPSPGTYPPPAPPSGPTGPLGPAPPPAQAPWGQGPPTAGPPAPPPPRPRA